MTKKTLNQFKSIKESDEGSFNPKLHGQYKAAPSTDVMTPGEVQKRAETYIKHYGQSGYKISDVGKNADGSWSFTTTKAGKVVHHTFHKTGGKTQSVGGDVVDHDTLSNDEITPESPRGKPADFTALYKAMGISLTPPRVDAIPTSAKEKAEKSIRKGGRVKVGHTTINRMKDDDDDDDELKESVWVVHKQTDGKGPFKPTGVKETNLPFAKKYYDDQSKKYGHKYKLIPENIIVEPIDEGSMNEKYTVHVPKELAPHGELHSPKDSSKWEREKYKKEFKDYHSAIEYAEGFAHQAIVKRGSRVVGHSLGESVLDEISQASISKSAEGEWQAGIRDEPEPQSKVKKFDLVDKVSGMVKRSFNTAKDAVEHHTNMPARLKAAHKIVPA